MSVAACNISPTYITVTILNSDYVSEEKLLTKIFFELLYFSLFRFSFFLVFFPLFILSLPYPSLFIFLSCSLLYSCLVLFFLLHFLIFLPYIFIPNFLFAFTASFSYSCLVSLILFTDFLVSYGVEICSNRICDSLSERRNLTLSRL